MNVGELKAALAAFPDDLEVIRPETWNYEPGDDGKMDDTITRVTRGKRDFDGDDWVVLLS